MPPNTPVRVIAFDPGYERLGVAVVEKQQGKDVVVFSTTLRTSADSTFYERLHFLGDEVKALIHSLSPSHAALETLFFQKNIKTALKVAEVRGMLIYIASSSNLIIEEYSPQQVKIAVTGEGGSDKSSMMRMLPKIVSLGSKKMLDDEYDAIAVGITCLAHFRKKR